MRLGTVSQQPNERLSYTVTYEEFLTDGDNVETATAFVEPPGLLVESVSVMDPRVRFFISGGEAGVKYKVTLNVETADGRRLQDEVFFRIREI